MKWIQMLVLEATLWDVGGNIPLKFAKKQQHIWRMITAIYICKDNLSFI